MEIPGRVICELKGNLKLSLRGSVERASSTWAGSAEDARSRIGVSRKVVGQIFREGIYLGVSFKLLYEYSSTNCTCVSPCVRACIKVLSKYILCTKHIILNLIFYVLLSLSFLRTLCILSFPLNLCFSIYCYPAEPVVISFRTLTFTIFGSIDSVHVPDEQRQKFDPKLEK